MGKCKKQNYFANLFENIFDKSKISFSRRKKLKSSSNVDYILYDNL